MRIKNKIKTFLGERKPSERVNYNLLIYINFDTKGKKGAPKKAFGSLVLPVTMKDNNV
jgi:hypothetical protein